MAALAAAVLPTHAWANLSHLGDGFWYPFLAVVIVAPPLAFSRLAPRGRRVLAWIGLQLLCLGLGFGYFHVQSSANRQYQERVNASVFAGIDAPRPGETGFPEESAPFPAADLEGPFAGRVFKLTESRRSGTWRLDFRASHEFFVDGDATFRDAGEWRVDGTRLCVKGRKIAASCHEVRRRGDTLLLRRTTGEVVTLTPE